MRRFLFSLLLTVALGAQQQPPVSYQPQLISFPGVPTGPCDIYQFAINSSTGTYYTCKVAARTWVTISNANYSTSSATTGVSIGTTTMLTVGATASKYVFHISAVQVGGGTSCTTNSTLAVNVNYTDAITGAAQVPSPGAYSLAANVFTGNATPTLAVNNGVANTYAIDWVPMTLNAKAATTISYSTTYTAGANCSPAPTYYVNPVLIQVQ